MTVEIYKPVLPGERDPEHFDIGDEVIAFDTKHWAKGKVIEGFRHHDGCMTIEFEGGKTLTYGLFRPEVMFLHDYRYFRAHPEFAQTWIFSRGDLRELNPEAILAGLLEGEDLLA